MDYGLANSSVDQTSKYLLKKLNSTSKLQEDILSFEYYYLKHKINHLLLHVLIANYSNFSVDMNMN